MDKDIYSKAVEQNVEHGVSLTNEEEERIIIELFEQGKTQEEMGKIFHIGQSAIAMRIKRNKILAKSLSDKINISSVNELLSGNKQSDIANNYGITQGRVSQIWGDWITGIKERVQGKRTDLSRQATKVDLYQEALLLLIYNEMINHDNALRELGSN